MVEENLALFARNLVVGYREPVAGPLDLELDRGELLLLTGKNGSGKTTFLKTTAGLLKPLRGSIEAPGAILLPTRIPKVKGFTVNEFLKISKAVAGLSYVEQLGLAGYENKDISTLSDGQFQKVCICAALGSGKTLILLDEPTAFLDSSSRESLLKTLKSITSGKKVSVIIASHDVADCQPFCTKTLEF